MNSKQSKLTLFSVIIVICCITAAAVYAVMYQRSLQPLEEISTEVSLPIPPPEMNIFFGFLPFWLFQDVYIPKKLTHVAYFSVPVQADGEWQMKDGKAPNPGWRTFESDKFNDLRIQTLTQDQKLILTMTMLDADAITGFLNSPQAQATMIENTRDLLKNYAIDGINLDFETSSPSSSLQRRQFNGFIKEFSKELRKYDPKPELSIDVYATAAKPTQLWDLVTLAPLVDHIIVMGYDFHQRSSPVAGPIAPMYGKSIGRWDADLMTSLKSLTENAPPEKFVLGIPLYGYEWQTSGDTLGAPTFPKSGRTASLKRIRELLLQPTAKLHWDWDSLSPYITYLDEGTTKVISFENEQSLPYKLKSAREAGFAGVAFWAVGYAGAEDPVWSLLPAR